MVEIQPINNIPDIQPIEEAGYQSNDTFVLIADMPPQTPGKRRWTRVFGPFETRAAAYSFRDRMLRRSKELDYHSEDWLNDIKFTTTTLWVPTKNVRKER